MPEPRARILVGDVRERLSDIAPGSVQTVVTSPPYWGLRDYGDPRQIGLEATPEAYVEALGLAAHVSPEQARELAEALMRVADGCPLGADVVDATSERVE